MHKKKSALRISFADIVKDEKKKPKNYRRFDALVTPQFILFVPDNFIKFSGRRHPGSYHDSHRPTAVISKKNFQVTFIPSTSKRIVKENGRRFDNMYDFYSVRVQANEINGLTKAGWFITRYPQKESADKIETMNVKPGSKIPDKVFEQIIWKLNAFIDKQGKY